MTHKENIDQLIQKYKTLRIPGKLMVIYLAVFILFSVINVFFELFKVSLDQIASFLFELPANLNSFILRPWTLVTYNFYHSNLWGLIINITLLNFGGRLFLNVLSAKKFINVYFMGVIAGGLVFLLSYNLFPVFDEVEDLGTMEGAYAGVLSVFIFMCRYLPTYRVNLFFSEIPIKYIGIAIIILEILFVSQSNNVGESLSHFGGATLGYFYADSLRKGIDIGLKFESLWSSLSRWFNSLFDNSNIKVIHVEKDTSNKSKQSRNDEQKKSKQYTTQQSKQHVQKEPNQRKLNKILEKISKSGYKSLTDEEKEFLFNSDDN